MVSTLAGSARTLSVENKIAAKISVNHFMPHPDSPAGLSTPARDSSEVPFQSQSVALLAKRIFRPNSYAVPWRRKPNSRLRYRSNGRPAEAKACGFKTILVYCVGPPDRDPRPRCWHSSAMPLDRLPDWDWYDIRTRLVLRQA